MCLRHGQHKANSGRFDSRFGREAKAINEKQLAECSITESVGNVGFGQVVRTENIRWHDRH